MTLAVMRPGTDDSVLISAFLPASHTLYALYDPHVLYVGTDPFTV